MGQVASRGRRRVAFSAVLAVCTLVAACGSSGSHAAKSTTGGSVKVSMFGEAPESVKNLNTNDYTAYAEKLTGLKFSFNLTPVADSSDAETKQGLVLASGQYPDVIWNGIISNADALKYGTEHVFVPLQKLIQQYAPNLWNVIQTTPGYKAAITASGGNIYALPAYNYCPHCSWTYEDYINIGLLSKYGLSVPRTTAQFASVLNVLKQHGITPMSGAIDAYDADPIQYLMNSFIPFDGDLGTTTNENYVDVNSSKQAVFVPTQAQWQKGLEYIASLYKNGDFSATAFTQQPTALESLISRNDLGVFPNGADETIINGYGSAGSHYADWMALPPLKGPSGASYSAFGGTGIGPGFVFAITNKASKAAQIGIMKLLNVMYTTKGSLHYNLGSYAIPASKGSTGLTPGPAIFNVRDLTTAFVTPNFEQNSSWFQFGPFYTGPAIRLHQESPAPFLPSGSETWNELSTEAFMAGHQAKYQYPTSVFVPSADAQTFGTQQTNIDTYVDQWTDEFVTGQKSVTSDWSSYVSGLKSLGLSSYMQTVQKIMGTPLDTSVSAYQASPATVKFLLCKGPVPSEMKKYLLEAGVPAADFACK